VDIAHLVHMANRIGQFFEAMPDRPEALDGIAEHLRKFWEPRMRRTLLDALDGPGCAELHPMVREAVERHRAALTPKTAAAPAA
jgi:formate dehydrogenase subunit delta